MKKILILLLTLPLIMFAQEVEFSKNFDVKAGEPYKVIDGRSKEYFPDNEGNIIAVKTDGARVFIQKFNSKSQKEISRKEYDDFPKYTKVQKVVKFGDRLFYFFASYDKKERRESVYVREVNMENGTFEKAKFLFKTTGEVVPQTLSEVMGFWGFGTGPKFDFHTSYDNSKFMIQYRLKPTTKRDKNSYDKLGFYVFNSSDVSKVWGKEVKMPYTEAIMNNISYTVGSEGNAYMIAYKTEDKDYELLEMVKGSSEINVKELEIDGAKYLNDIRVLEDKEGNLNCAGYYANGVEFTYSYIGGFSAQINVNGIYQFSMSKDGELISENTSEFPIEMINQFESKRDKNKNDRREDAGKAGIRDLKLRELIENEDGSTLIIGEQYYMKTEMRGTSTTTFYYYADMVATKITKDGDIEWMKKLPKTQKGTTGRGGMSVKYAQKDDDIYLMFLDNVKNLDLAKDEAPKTHVDGKGGFLTAYKIDDQTGEVEKLSILDTRDLDGVDAYQFKTTRLLLANENQLFLEVYIKGKKDSLIKIELK